MLAVLRRCNKATLSAIFIGGYLTGVIGAAAMLVAFGIRIGRGRELAR